ncbi:hypothetical protein niasHS_007664 [Heterodera schachtii]|uniref:G-protein coupled receptors family 1 profile domain-containing protein n=1 Tax=Heterodera schachtii TaxID=97005 RepID=A0ABD2JPG6_HETSC
MEQAGFEPAVWLSGPLFYQLNYRPCPLQLPTLLDPGLSYGRPRPFSSSLLKAFWAGAIASLICATTVAVFFSSSHFLKLNKLLALLSVADLCSCLGILALGLMRKALYERIVETSQVPLETIWSCASKPFVFLRLIGVIVPPWVILWISAERFMAVLTPKIYCRHIFKRLAINCATALRLARLRSHLKSRGHIQRQLNRVHYMLIISLFSTLTVTVPNVLFLSNILFRKWMHSDLTDPSNWMITAKCAANFFVFLLFKEEFRVRIYEILGCISRDPSNERQYEVSALGIAMTSRRRKISVAVVEQQRNDQQQKMQDEGFFMLADMLVNKSSKSNNELTVEMGRGGRGEEQTTRRSANF